MINSIKLCQIVIFILGITQTSNASESETNSLFEVDYPTSWAMFDGQHINFQRKEQRDSIKVDTGKVMLALPENELIVQIIQSNNKKFLLCRINSYLKMGAGIGYYYSALGLITKTASEWSLARILAKEQLLETVMVSELGTISDDGKQAFLKIGRQSAPVAPYSMRYTWETWDLQSAKVVKTGIPTP